MSPPPAPEKPNVIRRIVKLKQVLKRWRNAASDSIPPDVPSGHIAVYVGAGFKRFVVRATYLNHPLFASLLAQAEEEFGFANQGPLVIPCDESTFEEALRSVSSSSPPPRDASLELAMLRCYIGGDSFANSRPVALSKFIC
uniref:SAUR family protein n=1 Tax=Kalanchoe fedtschenkoi TaxID=63787 RepID=A0A7N0T221_KALFE